MQTLNRKANELTKIQIYFNSNQLFDIESENLRDGIRFNQSVTELNLEVERITKKKEKF